MNRRVKKFSAIGSDGKEYEIFSIQKEIPRTNGVWDIPEYRLGSPTGVHLNKRDGGPFKTLDGELTLTAIE